MSTIPQENKEVNSNTSQVEGQPQHNSQTKYNMESNELQEIKTALLKRFRWIEQKISTFSQDGSCDEEKILRLTNSEQRVAKSVTDCIALSRDPRLNLYRDDDAEKDLARMVERVQKLLAEEEVEVEDGQQK